MIESLNLAGDRPGGQAGEPLCETSRPSVVFSSQEVTDPSVLRSSYEVNGVGEERDPSAVCTRHFILQHRMKIRSIE